MSSYGFLRWLRAGASAATTTPRSAATTRERAVFTAGIGLTDDLGGVLWPQRQLTLFGPGDVIGLDNRQVLRMEPAPNALDAEYDKFAHVEFDEPGLPWLFTPFHEETSEPTGSIAQLVRTDTVLPWIALVVVAERAGVDLRYEPGALLPVLHVDDATRELPNLNEAHAWAHVQVTGGLPATDTEFNQLLRGHPELSLSRLVCPRLLEPAKRYIACVVPVFKSGVLAGLGRSNAGVAAAELAYDAAKPQPVDLPAFLTWSFTTAPHAGFEALGRRLVPRSGEELAGVAQRALDVCDPGFGLSVRTGATVALGGALRVPGRQPADADDDLRNEIEQVVNRIEDVAPPLYGRWLAAVDQVPSAGQLTGRSKTLGWVRHLNIEPRHRVAAGLGTRVIQAEQEALMAAAWDQLGDVLRANQLLRQGQLALAVGAQLHNRHLAQLTTYARLQVAGPALARIRSADPTVTLHGVIEASCLPLEALHASFRRVTRPRGPLAQRAGRGMDLPRGFDTETLLDQLINGQLPATAPAPAGPTTTLTSDERDQVVTRLDGRGRGPLATHRRAIAARLRQLATRASPHSCSPPTDDPSARARPAPTRGHRPATRTGPDHAAGHDRAGERPTRYRARFS